MPTVDLGEGDRLGLCLGVWSLGQRVRAPQLAPTAGGPVVVTRCGGGAGTRQQGRSLQCMTRSSRETTGCDALSKPSAQSSVKKTRRGGSLFECARSFFPVRGGFGWTVEMLLGCRTPASSAATCPVVHTEQLTVMRVWHASMRPRVHAAHVRCRCPCDSNSDCDAQAQAALATREATHRCFPGPPSILLHARSGGCCPGSR